MAEPKLVLAFREPDIDTQRPFVEGQGKAEALGSKSWAPGIEVELLPKGADVDTMLLSGELDCVLEPNVHPSISKRDPRVRRLFPDFKTEEQKYFKATGIFPISHMVSFNKP